MLIFFITLIEGTIFIMRGCSPNETLTYPFENTTYYLNCNSKVNESINNSFENFKKKFFYLLDIDLGDVIFELIYEESSSLEDDWEKYSLFTIIEPDNFTKFKMVAPYSEPYDSIELENNLLFMFSIIVIYSLRMDEIGVFGNCSTIGNWTKCGHIYMTKSHISHVISYSNYPTAIFSPNLGQYKTFTSIDKYILELLNVTINHPVEDIETPNISDCNYTFKDFETRPFRPYSLETNEGMGCCNYAQSDYMCWDVPIKKKIISPPESNNGSLWLIFSISGIILIIIILVLLYIYYWKDNSNQEDPQMSI